MRVASAKYATAIIECEACPRLRRYCAEVAREKRRAYRDDTYWGKPVPGFGDPRARLLLVGLAPAAHGANRTGRVFTGDGVGGSGDFLMGALHRAGFANIPTSHDPNDGLVLRDAFIAAAVRCAPAGQQADAGGDRAVPPASRGGDRRPAARPRGRRARQDRVRRLSAASEAARHRRCGRGPRSLMASVIVCPTARRSIGCYHPSRQNTNTGKLTPQMMDTVFRTGRADGAQGSEVRRVQGSEVPGSVLAVLRVLSSNVC